MTNLDRPLTDALIANFKELADDRESMVSALLRLKGQELRLKSRIEARMRDGSILKTSLAREDRARLKIVRKSIEQLQARLRP